MIRKFLADSRDMLLDGLAKVGLIRGGSVWWRERMRRRMDALGGEAENVRRSVAVKHRMCRECRALVPVSESTCPECGASMHGVPKGGASRLMGMIAPSFGSASTVLLGFIAVVYVAAVMTGGGSILSNPMRSELGQSGAMIAPAIWRGGEWWRLVTAIFLHGGLLHLAFNAYALANIGPSLESAVGSRRVLVLFLVTGIGSFVTSSVFTHASVGASGAIFGLIGYGIVHGRVRGGTMYRAFSDDLLRWAFFGVLMSVMPGIDMAAHVGGLAVGAAAGLVVGRRTPRHGWVEGLWTFATAVGAILPFGCFLLALR